MPGEVICHLAPRHTVSSPPGHHSLIHSGAPRLFFERLTKNQADLTQRELSTVFLRTSLFFEHLNLPRLGVTGPVLRIFVPETLGNAKVTGAS